MIFWLNAQLPPSLAQWLSDTFNINVVALRDLGLRDALILLEQGGAIVEIGRA